MSFRSVVLMVLMAMPFAATAQVVQPDRFSEVRLGILAHDVGFAGGREGGADLNLELTSSTLVDPAWGGWAPPWAQWLLHPRAHAGVEVNVSGYTNQAYAGLTWTALVASDVLRDADAIEFSYLFGPSVNDADHRALRPDHKSLGSTVLFHLGVELAYRFTPVVAVGAYFDHTSNAGLARFNQSINDAGVRVAVRF